MQRVMDVDTIDISILNTLPPAILVVAHGHVPTTGWTGPQLSPWFYIRAPDDGIQDFDFVAQEPAGIVGDVVLPIVAEANVHHDVANYWGAGVPLRGVRVHARANSREELIDRPDAVKQAVPPVSARIVVPLDNFGIGAFDTPTIPDELRTLVIGKSLRVYKTGDMLTLDLQPNRLNIERAPVDGRIVGTWFG